MTTAAGPGPDPDGVPYDAVVLAGGAANRLGGADKPGIAVGGRPLLDRVLAACREAGRTVVVGGRRPTARPVVWAREDPPGGGPLAALDAGVRQLATPEDGAVVVLSADLPFLDRRTVRRLAAALGSGGREGAVLTDAGGRDQFLVAAYRAEPLRRELALLATEYGSLAGLPLKLLVQELDLERIAAEPYTAFDCDTWEDIAAARARIREHGTVLEEWITAVKDDLGIDLDVDTGLLLDLARDAAHGVARPAAPLTTFLVGYAAASAAGGGPEAVAEAVRRATALARRWAEETPGPDGPPTPGGRGRDPHPPPGGRRGDPHPAPGGREGDSPPAPGGREGDLRSVPGGRGTETRSAPEGPGSDPRRGSDPLPGAGERGGSGGSGGGGA